MKKLILLPGGFKHLGGTVVSLSLLIDGFKRLGKQDRLCVIVQAGSVTHQYLEETGQTECIHLIDASSQMGCMKKAFTWISQQPKENPLLLDNWTNRKLMPLLMLESIRLRLARRPVYHFCHDLCASNNYFGFLLRKLAFGCLSPKAICNSEFTAGYIKALMPKIQGILYQPVNTQTFSDCTDKIPAELASLLKNGKKILLTPSRLNKPGIVNDKNLRALIPVLAELKAMGHNYHSVIIGSDQSPDGSYRRALLEQAEQFGVGDRLSILPPKIAIEKYYPHASAVVTLAPREPFGRIVVEAIACGVPVVGSNTGGIHEILQNFAPEWIVAPNDPLAVANKILQLTQVESTNASLAMGKAWIQSNCSVEDYAAGMMRLTELSFVA